MPTKAKLPRKRKKKAIKAQGRKWYYDTIKLWNITQKQGISNEPRCKFWDNSSIQSVPRVFPNGQLMLIPMATRFF